MPKGDYADPRQHGHKSSVAGLCATSPIHPPSESKRARALSRCPAPRRRRRSPDQSARGRQRAREHQRRARRSAGCRPISRGPNTRRWRSKPARRPGNLHPASPNRVRGRPAASPGRSDPTTAGIARTLFAAHIAITLLLRHSMLQTSRSSSVIDKVVTAKP